MSTTKPSGYGTLTLGGQDRPFQVGPNQADIFCRLPHQKGEDGRPLSMRVYSELFSLDSLKEERLSAGDLRDFVFSALAAGYENDGLRVDFTHLDVGNWIGDPDADPKEVTAPITEMFAQVLKRYEHALERAAKNAPAPTPAPVKGPKNPSKNKPKTTA